jgi:hypothetical protein
MITTAKNTARDYRSWEERHNRDFGIWIAACLAFLLMLCLVSMVKSHKDYETLWAQSEAQNSCLALAVKADAQGHGQKATAYMNAAWEAQYFSIPCE